MARAAYALRLTSGSGIGGSAMDGNILRRTITMGAPQQGLIGVRFQLKPLFLYLKAHDGSETPSTISLKQVSTIAEMRNTDHRSRCRNQRSRSPEYAREREAPNGRKPLSEIAVQGTMHAWS